MDPWPLPCAFGGDHSRVVQESLILCACSTINRTNLWDSLTVGLSSAVGALQQRFFFDTMKMWRTVYWAKYQIKLLARIDMLTEYPLRRSFLLTLFIEKSANTSPGEYRSMFLCQTRLSILIVFLYTVGISLRCHNRHYLLPRYTM